MKVARDLMVEVTSLKRDEYVTRARQILRDDVYREIYITDDQGHLRGMIDITDVLRVTDTRSNVTIAGFIRDVSGISPDTPLEEAASAILKAGTDSIPVSAGNGKFIGSILLRDLFPILVSRHEITGLVRDAMTEDVVCCNTGDSIQKVYSLITDTGYASLPIVRGKELLGVISRRDLVENGGIRRSLGNSTRTQVNKVMTTPVITATPDMQVSEASHLLVSHDISRMPVVSEGTVVGILDRHDVLRTIVKKA
ncbi:CBS domain-containing protein [Methanocalculus alkaliphilus]|uniref:CBS domain-containing protein n=1 Tax=Methanocalculus alkaliphilus TaxID=768730 RepID=UPI0020A04AB6|nr:CBS domain-containing protein [Methanocalculus alkaliphilus]MCP1715567.1 CBS domain-containing protein [Methanocalculus alkaliphilus]